TVEIDGTRRTVTCSTVLDRPFVKLQRFRREGCERRQDPKILLVAPLSGHYATLLRGTVAALLPDHDVFITDWKEWREVPLSEVSIDVDKYIYVILRFMRHPGRYLHVLAVRQPAPLALASVTILAQADDQAPPRTMTQMGGPV